MEQTVQSIKQWTESKEVRKARKRKEKAEKLATQVEQQPKPVVASDKRYVVCLKHGTKYKADYVNRLKNMVDRNITVPYEFVCFTENPTNIDKDIRIEPLPSLATQGWWYKPYFMSADLPLDGTMLYLDLDVVVFRNIDELFTYKPDKFCIIRDFNRHIRPTWDRMNSSVFRTTVGQYDRLWQDYKRNLTNHTARNRGDQDWMYRGIKDHEFWPDEWIMSYKWEMREKKSLTIVNGKRNFAEKANPRVQPSTKIAVFHGDPNPHICEDPWVIERWV